MNIINTSEFTKISGIYNFHSRTRNPEVVATLITHLDSLAENQQVRSEPIRVLLDFHKGLPSLNQFFRDFSNCLERNPILNTGRYAIVVESEFFVKLVDTVVDVYNLNCEIGCYVYHETAQAMQWLHKLD